jgi:hypothetical protein
MRFRLEITATKVDGKTKFAEAVLAELETEIDALSLEVDGTVYELTVATIERIRG